MPDPLDLVSLGPAGNEPVLGPRQANLVDALTERIANGPQLSDADDYAVGFLTRVLGLEPATP